MNARLGCGAAAYLDGKDEGDHVRPERQGQGAKGAQENQCGSPENDLKRDGERELKTRQQKCLSVNLEDSSALLPEVGPGEVNELIAAASHDGLQHVKSEALGHVGRN